MPDSGDEALHRIDTHEQVCSERYKSLEETIKGLGERLGDIEKRIGLVGWVVAGGLAMAVLTLLLDRLFK